MPAFADVGVALGILLAGVLPTQIWRWLGVLLAGRLADTSELFVFVKAVATALVAAVIAKLVISPSGVLQETPLALRLCAMAAGIAVYFIGGQRIVFGILATEAVLVGGWLSLR